VAAAARAHDAAFFHIRPLKLDLSVRPHYYEMLAEHFPALLPPTTSAFAGHVNPARGYVDELERRVARIRARYGFRDDHQRAESALRRPRSGASGPDQLRLAI
jgi:hypothetical protein